MRILIIDTYYPRFLAGFYRQRRGFAEQSYRVQWQTLMGQFFGTADSYSSNLSMLGHEAWETVPNCEGLQRAWAREHGVSLPPELPSVALKLPGYHLLAGHLKLDMWMWIVLARQVQDFRPDVVYVQDIGFLDVHFIRQHIRPHTRLLVGQHAATLPSLDRCKEYDLILSSLPNQVEYFRDHGIRSDYFRIGFDDRVLASVNADEKRYDVVYIGGLAAVHSDRKALLEQVASRLKIDCWGYGAESLGKNSALRRSFRGSVWGLDMYRTRAQAKVVLNGHSSAADGYANNMCLFETSGVGTLLVTDAKRNLPDLFEPGTEVVSYENADDCVEKLTYYLDHDASRAKVARAGQTRTLREHTYRTRINELVAILERCLAEL